MVCQSVFLCSCYNAGYYGDLEIYFFVSACEHLGMTPLTRKQGQKPKKSTVIDHILLKNHDVSFENLTILLIESNKFKLYLKESLLIKCDKPELNRKMFSYPLEHFDSLFYNLYYCIIICAFTFMS